jgi:hypothetical protein
MQPIVKISLASLIGTTIEWYDFLLYGTATALVFNRLFFPDWIRLLARWPRSRHSRPGSSRDPSAERSSATSATRAAASQCSS